jgi:pSer/pThr/pTyr-binding forkhead associated (FHA) protein
LNVSARIQADTVDGQRLVDVIVPAGRFILGRRHDCDLVLDHPSVSRQHASLQVSERGCTMVNESLSNGVVCNGRPIKEQLHFRTETTFAIGEVIVYVEPRLSNLRYALVTTSDAPLRHTIPIVDGQSVIGRSTSVEIPLDHHSISRHHARLVHRHNETVIVDLGSTNGTRVNGQLATQPMVVRPGDLVQIGDVPFAMQSVNSARQSRAEVMESGQFRIRPPASRTLALASVTLTVIAVGMLLLLLLRGA